MELYHSIPYKGPALISEQLQTLLISVRRAMRFRISCAFILSSSRNCCGFISDLTAGSTTKNVSEESCSSLAVVY